MSDSEFSAHADHYSIQPHIYSQDAETNNFINSPSSTASPNRQTPPPGKVEKKGNNRKKRNNKNKKNKNKAKWKQNDASKSIADENYFEEGTSELQDPNNYYSGELLMHTYYTLPPSVQKFWTRRYELFSKYDEGIFLSEELWYSVTPELVAKYTAQLFVKLLPTDTQYGLDVCCGGGGNTIQFARYFESVGAIDINRTNLYCTERNCQVYGVDDKVWTLQADWAEITKRKDNGTINLDWIPEKILEERRVKVANEIDTPVELNSSDVASSSIPTQCFDFIFSSPPWGGTNYDKNEFNVYEMKPFNIVDLLRTMKQYADNIGLFLPKLSNLMQLSMATKEVYGDFKKCRVIYINSKGRSVAMLALFGDSFTARFDELDDISEEALRNEFERGSPTYGKDIEMEQDLGLELGLELERELELELELNNEL